MSNFGINVYRPTNVQPRDDLKIKESGQKTEISETTGLLEGVGDNFGGSKVELKQSEVSKGVDNLRKQSERRLGDPPGFGAKVGKFLSYFVSTVVTGVTSLTTTVLGGLQSLVGGGLSKLMQKDYEKEFGIDNSQQLRRDNLGEPMRGSVLEQFVTINGEDMPMKRALDELHGNLLKGGERLPLGDVYKYVAMGEKIMHALSHSEGNPKELQIVGKDGEMHTIKPDLETTRAISWYLQAKAISDNSGSDMGAFLKEGAMIAKDPGNKLYNFLRSSNESYGRVSSHMQERSQSVTMNGFKQGFEGGFTAVLAGGLKGQPLQYGIEDFDNRMPSKGGSLLFDKLHSSRNDGVPEIYLKWENVGMPKSIAPKSNESTWSRGNAFFRCLSHTFTFLQNKDPGGSYRGEKVTKGEMGRVYEGFKKTVEDMEGVDDKTKKSMLKHVERHGATEMVRVLDMLLETEGVSNNEKTKFFEVRENLTGLMARMGGDFGIDRKGGEIHLALPGTEYDR